MHLICLMTTVLAFNVVVESRSVVVTVVLGATAELSLFTLIVAVVEIGTDVTLLAKVAQLFMKIMLLF